MFESLPTIQKYDKSVSEYERLKLYSVYLLNIQKKKKEKSLWCKISPQKSRNRFEKQDPKIILKKYQTKTGQ